MERLGIAERRSLNNAQLYRTSPEMGATFPRTPPHAASSS
jgi:hypothetical protein